MKITINQKSIPHKYRNKHLRDRGVSASTVITTSSGSGSTTVSTVFSGDYLPATLNEDGTYTVDASAVKFEGHVVASGEVIAHQSGSATSGDGSYVTVIDSLNSDSTTDALSASQGKVLKGMIEDLDYSNYYTKNEINDKLGSVEVDLSYYYNKDQVYNKEEVDILIENIKPEDIDLTDYYTKSEVDQKIEDIEISGGVDLSNYYTKSETYTKKEVDDLIDNIEISGGGDSEDDTQTISFTSQQDGWYKIMDSFTSGEIILNVTRGDEITCNIYLYTWVGAMFPTITQICGSAGIAADMSKNIYLHMPENYSYTVKVTGNGNYNLLDVPSYYDEVLGGTSDICVLSGDHGEIRTNGRIRSKSIDVEKDVYANNYYFYGTLTPLVANEFSGYTSSQALSLGKGIYLRDKIQEQERVCIALNNRADLKELVFIETVLSIYKNCILKIEGTVDKKPILSYIYISDRGNSSKVTHFGYNFGTVKIYKYLKFVNISYSYDAYAFELQITRKTNECGTDLYCGMISATLSTPESINTHTSRDELLETKIDLGNIEYTTRPEDIYFIKEVSGGDNTGGDNTNQISFNVNYDDDNRCYRLLELKSPSSHVNFTLITPSNVVTFDACYSSQSAMTMTMVSANGGGIYSHKSNLYDILMSVDTDKRNIGFMFKVTKDEVSIPVTLIVNNGFNYSLVTVNGNFDYTNGGGRKSFSPSDSLIILNDKIQS